MCNFALAFFTNTSIGKCRVDGWGRIYRKGVYQRFVLWLLKVSQTLNLLSKTKQRVDVRMVCLYAPSMFVSSTWRATIFITAWALRVARQTIGAMRDALSSETSNRYSTRAFFVQIKKPNHNETCWGCCKCIVSFRNGRAISTVEQQAAHWQSDKGRTWKTGTNRQLVCTKVVLRPIQCLQTVQAVYNRHWVTGKSLTNIAVWLLWTLQEHIIGTNRHRSVAAQASVLFNPLQR